MYIHKTACYIPGTVVHNHFFEEINGLTHDWIVERTGIRERRKAADHENTNTMAIESARLAVEKIDFQVKDIDLIVGGTYSPHDTIVTLAHAIQHNLDIHDIPVVSVSSACSSLINCMEIVQGYFAMNKASRALVCVSEHNTAYNNYNDPKSGHLWGDGACTIIVTQEKVSEQDFEIKDIHTSGAATVGKATESIYLRPANGGLKMPMGKDVFINACNYMAKATRDILYRNQLDLDDLDYLIPHQANMRIIKNVANSLKFPEEKTLSNLEYLGNTGAAGCGIVLCENWDKFEPGKFIVLTVFGGGYSYGAMLIKT